MDSTWKQTDDPNFRFTSFAYREVGFFRKNGTNCSRHELFMQRTQNTADLKVTGRFAGIVRVVRTKLSRSAGLPSWDVLTWGGEDRTSSACCHYTSANLMKPVYPVKWSPEKNGKLWWICSIYWPVLWPVSCWRLEVVQDSIVIFPPFDQFSDARDFEALI